MVKDRLNELKEYQQKKPKKENSVVQIESSSSDAQPENGGKKIRRIFERGEAMGQWIEQIEKNNRDVRLYFNKLGEIKTNQRDLEDKINSLFQNNTSIGHQITSKLKEMDEEMIKINRESTEGRIQKIQYSTFKKRYHNAFLENSQLLEDYKNKQKQMIRAQLQAKGDIQVTDEELTRLLDEGTDLQVFTENILKETAEAKRVLASVEERHQQLLQIERMLTEVRDMFLEMSLLVSDQQQLIDRIEYQAQSATDYIGAVDLKAVRKQKKKYMKRKFYFIIAIIILVAIILAILLR